MLKRLLRPFFAAADARAELEIVRRDLDFIRSKYAAACADLAFSQASSAADQATIRALNRQIKRMSEARQMVDDYILGLCEAGTADETEVPMAADAGKVVMFPGVKLETKH